MSTGSGRGEATVVEATRLQRAAARRAAESRATIPYAEMTAEVTLPGPEGISAALLSAVAGALRAVPRANASYSDGAFVEHGRVNIALAVDTDDGLVLATVFDADTRTRDQLAATAAELQARAHAGTLTAPEQSGATITVWDLSQTAVRAISPVIVPPHGAALGAGGVHATPVVGSTGIVPGHTMCLTLATDHRILYGRRAAEFLAAVRSRLEGGT